MAQQVDFDPNVDYYKALGVGEKASAEEIKRAYRKLAKAYHPDSTGGDKAKESRFKDISVANDVLGDPKKRALYDQIRANGGMPQQGFPQGSYYSTQSGDLFDLFGQFFNQGPGRAGRMRVEHVDLGDDRPRGRARRRDTEDAEFESKVKAADGSWLRSSGKDVFSDVRIPFDRAILGTIATVPTIDGKAEVKVPPGTSSGKKLRLRGKGLPDRTGGTGVGDHYITVQIDVPGDLDDDAKKLLVQLASRTRKRGHHD